MVKTGMLTLLIKTHNCDEQSTNHKIYLATHSNKQQKINKFTRYQFQRFVNRRQKIVEKKQIH